MRGHLHHLCPRLSPSPLEERTEKENLHALVHHTAQITRNTKGKHAAQIVPSLNGRYGSPNAPTRMLASCLRYTGRS